MTTEQEERCAICGGPDAYVCEDCGGLYCCKHGGRIHGDKKCPDSIAGCHGMLIGTR